VLRADAVCFVRVATLCVMLSLMLCCPARALGYTATRRRSRVKSFHASCCATCPICGPRHGDCHEQIGRSNLSVSGFILQAQKAAPSIGILPHITSQFRRFEKERPSVITRVIIRERKFESAHQASHQVSPPPCAAAEPRMGDHESDGLEYQDDEEEEDEDDESVHDLTGGGALLSVQPPAATAAPRLHNAPRECAIRMPRGKAANTPARGPITPATGPGQASTRFCN